jgi:hypothetical protein
VVERFQVHGFGIGQGAVDVEYQGFEHGNLLVETSGENRRKGLWRLAKRVATVRRNLDLLT